MIPIVGNGLAGLTLVMILLEADIPYKVFERVDEVNQTTRIGQMLQQGHGSEEFIVYRLLIYDLNLRQLLKTGSTRAEILS
ncbi:hypothetical protein BGZ95_010916 [Linnemannia exigua]|uniref:FAD-binding domain-containing protein n=1 Tax=Linnemannia exigua TaxID=604196 RepID=A0AAD4DAR3_9FUNG|nr:hypothetical protein BGZ95_010916 [Linnemannia exigua]